MDIFVLFHLFIAICAGSLLIAGVFFGKIRMYIQERTQISVYQWIMVYITVFLGIGFSLELNDFTIFEEECINYVLGECLLLGRTVAYISFVLGSLLTTLSYFNRGSNNVNWTSLVAAGVLMTILGWFWMLLI